MMDNKHQFVLTKVEKEQFKSKFNLYPRFRGTGFRDSLIDTHIRTNGINSEGVDKLRRTKWYNYLVYTFSAIAIQLICGWSYAFPDGRPACAPNVLYIESRKVEITVNSYAPDARNSKICDLVETFNWGHRQLLFLTAIVLGGYLVSTINYWRLRRINYMDICGSMRNLTIQIGTLVAKHNINEVMKNEEEEQENTIWVKERNQMLRWVILGYELCILDARNEIDTDVGRKRLEDMDLLREGEWEDIVNGDHLNTLWFWVQRKAVTLTDQGVISSEQRLQTICSAISRTRGATGMPMRELFYDHCPVYTSVVGITICYTIINFIFWKGFQWAIWFYDTNGAVWKEPRMYVEVLISISYTTILSSIFDIDKVMHNPFWSRPIDLPCEEIGLRLFTLAQRFGYSKQCFPSDIVDKEIIKLSSKEFSSNTPEVGSSEKSLSSLFSMGDNN